MDRGRESDLWREEIIRPQCRDFAYYGDSVDERNVPR